MAKVNGEKPLLDKHVVELSEAPDVSKYFVLDSLFKLPEEILQPLLDKHIVELYKVCGDYNFAFIDSLFKLPTETLQPLLDKHVVDLYKARLNSQYLITTKLTELPPETSWPLLNKHLVELINIHDISDPYFLPLLEAQNGLQLSLVELEKVNFENYQNLTLLKYTSSLINDLSIDNQAQLTPIIKSILSKTYYQESNLEKRKIFVDQLIEGLKEIIESETIILKILDNASTTGGDIFITTNNKLKESGATGLYVAPNIFMASDQPGIASILGTLVHEATHKLIDLKFGNELLPYNEGDKSFEPISLEMCQALKEEQKLYSLLYLNKHQEQAAASLQNSTGTSRQGSWLSSMVESYPPEKFALEILPHFTGNMAETILRKENKDGVSESFANIIWHYLHKQLFNELPPALPSTYCTHVEIVNNQKESASIQAAKNIILTEEPSITWLRKEAGDLAFQALPRSIKSNYLKKLFTLPTETLNPLLDEYVIKLLELSGYHKHILIESILKLPADILNPLLDKHAVKLLEVSGDHKYSLIEGILKLHTEILQPLLDKHLVKILELSDTNKYYLTDAIFKLPSEILYPMLDKQLMELLDASGIGKCGFVYQLFMLPVESLQPLVAKYLVELCDGSGDIKNSFINSILNKLPSEILNPLVAKSLLAVLESPDGSDYGLDEALFAVPLEILKPWLDEYGSELLGIIGNEKYNEGLCNQHLELLSPHLSSHMADLEKIHTDSKEDFIRQLSELNIKELKPYLASCLISYPVSSNLTSELQQEALSVDINFDQPSAWKAYIIDHFFKYSKSKPDSLEFASGGFGEGTANSATEISLSTLGDNLNDLNSELF